MKSPDQDLSPLAKRMFGIGYQLADALAKLPPAMPQSLRAQLGFRLLFWHAMSCQWRDRGTKKKGAKVAVLKLNDTVAYQRLVEQDAVDLAGLRKALSVLSMNMYG